MKTVGLIVLGLLVAVFAFIGILYSTRGTPLKTVRAFGDETGPPPVGDSLFRQTMELLTSTELTPGNHVEVMINGDQTYPRLFDDLRSARETITMQMYYCQPGAMADSFKTILSDRARAGVRVLFLVDAFGAQNLSKKYLDSLSQAGVRVAQFRPVHWYSLHKAQSRSHIRVVVIDGRTSWTGGFGIADKWFGDGRSKDSWRDTNARFTGPAVAQHQATFVAGWVEATGELLTGPLFFPEPAVSATGVDASLMHLAPTIGSTPAERFLALSIAGARKTLYITNSYFVPDDDFRRLMINAAKRGVDVRILTTGAETDIKTTWYAGRGHYEELLRGGVRVYEYQPSMMHAKSLVVDGLWSSLGTMNFDNRSLVFNDESQINVLDASFGGTMNAIFLEDLKYAKEIVLEEFQNRPWMNKLLERGATALGRVL
jgi:cardiolipin synthase